VDIDAYAGETVHRLMIYPQQLEVRAALARILFVLRETSETQGIEHGRNLFFEEGRIVATDLIEGTQGRIFLDATGASKDPDYIGDVHVHPYRKKMHDTTSVGFSTEDITSYMRKRGPGIPDRLHFHFVVGGPKVWLIVMYPWSEAEPSGQLQGTGDVDAAMQVLYADPALYKKWHAGQHAINDASILKDKIGAERRMWDQIPEYPAVFAKASKTMNKNLANFHKYGLYIGKFGVRRTDTMIDLVLNRKI
jgi:hypothetical protein